MAGEREWVPVEVLWDEELRRGRREADLFWADAGAAQIDWPQLIEEDYRDTPPLSKRRRKKLRGGEGTRER